MIGRAPGAISEYRCHCCGRDSAQTGGLVRVHADQSGSNELWACEKHLGRAPCCIEGCGKTWALKEEDLSVIFICGKHWRVAPAFMRRRVTAIKQRARRRGWDDRLYRLHGRAFDRVLAAVRHRLEGGIDVAEIERLFG